jgi:uncharacterized protein (TIGR04255 family)
MGKTRKYPNAPITEAIIQLLVEPAAGQSFAQLALCHEGEENAYPTKNEILLETGMQISTSLATQLAQQHRFIYSSADKKQVYQVRTHGFSFSRLAPYDSWEPFSNEARRLWQVYRERLKPLAVTRQSVRYVNRLDVPAASRIEIKDYLRTQPEIAEGLPQTLVGYFMQLQIPIEDIRCHLLLNETIGESSKSGCVGLILDIDLFRADDIPQDEGGIWQMFETMRVRKNEIFEACITDRARELFQ